MDESGHESCLQNKEIKPQPRQDPKPLTIAVFGMHCSGKSTISRRLAQFLNCPFDKELGDILRDKENLVANGHLLGNGTSKGSCSWDDQIFEQECARDHQKDSSSTSRVVETWHIGNLAWACLRLEKRNRSENDRKALIARYRAAIQAECQRSLVILVNLEISPTVSLRRRHADSTNCLRVPLEEEETECQALYQALQVNAITLMHQVKPDHVPMLTVDNSIDGEEGIQATLKLIVDFVNERRAG
jgi:gluconate kinase